MPIHPNTRHRNSDGGSDCICKWEQGSVAEGRRSTGKEMEGDVAMEFSLLFTKRLTLSGGVEIIYETTTTIIRRRED
ncbi:hypothetical protein Sjap_016544 [Stephania japonica]|uniref:Uncharacterized protein n=1 Tax=Stephania japonica TaxID=461633 RepID=A0AAP0ILI1_9MAGN